MTKEEFAHWQAKTESSRNKWTEDEIFRLNGRGAFYYIGGEDGQFMKIHKDGLLQVGTYEGAIPHIGEALFIVQAKRQCKDFNEAFNTALTAGGKRFLVDMFRGNEPVIPSANNKPSVLDDLSEKKTVVAQQRISNKVQDKQNEL